MIHFKEEYADFNWKLETIVSTNYIIFFLPFQ